MIFESEILKKCIQLLLDFEEGHELPYEAVWSLNRRLYTWQRDFDPHEELFPQPIAAEADLEEFGRDHWPYLKTQEVYFSNNVERAFNMCLFTIANNFGVESGAMQILYAINPNVVVEKYALMVEQSPDFYFNEEEVDVIQDLMVSRLKTSDNRLMTLNFIRKAGEEIKKAGLNFYPLFKKLERKLQDKIVLKTPLNERVISSETKRAPELTLVPGGIDSDL